MRRPPTRFGCAATALTALTALLVLVGCSGRLAKSAGSSARAPSTSATSGSSPSSGTASPVTANSTVGATARSAQSAAPSTAPAPGSATETPPAPPPSTDSTTPTGPTPAQLLAAARNKAGTQIRALGKALGQGGVSIKALNPATGATFSYGSQSGMRTGSIIKLYILETLLLQHQNRGTHLTDVERAAAEEMIENSDDAAATSLFNEIGGKSGLDDVRDELGLHCTEVDGDEFGLTTTCAADFVNLVRAANAPGPLTEHSRDYILDLQARIEPDQLWGVSAAADVGTMTHLKNGWLDVDVDDGKWLVNSVGSLTVHGHKIYLAVLTQHGPGFLSGITRVEELANIAADVVAPR